MDIQSIFGVKNSSEFNALALKTYEFQFHNNLIYRDFCNYLGKIPGTINSIVDIPFLPIEFFKTKKIVSKNQKPEITFTSSGTTGSHTSKHHVIDLKLYQESYLKGFTHFYGAIEDYCILALLPSYLEREGSSLLVMVDDLIKKSDHSESGFYLDQFDVLKSKLQLLDAQGTKTLLIGVSFALLDFIEKHPLKLNHTIVMETGGMKGRRKELIREELHDLLSKGFGVQHIHSEYGMTELLSQAYSDGKGLFETPPWMKVFVRDTEDPLTLQQNKKTGGINIIDLANLNSCSFIATQDLGKVYANGSFEVLGRFDHSDVRGCNLMAL
jgi:phenylacetate-coenzyme A ligase PaaK-like adenylate-forming protein